MDKSSRTSVRNLSVLGVVLSASLLLSNCAGEVNNTEEQITQQGVEFGASREEYQQAFSDIEPINLVFQSSATSGESFFGERDLRFAESVNEWSNGTITIDVEWSGSIAGTTEVDAALSDGRLDLALYQFIFDPQSNPVANEIAESTVAQQDLSPLVGELVTNAAMAEAAWDTPEFHDELSDRGLTPIITMVPGGVTALACPAPHTTESDLDGAQIRSTSTAQTHQIQGIGANPASFEFTEVYEALQRNTLDCSLAQFAVWEGTGMTEIAPNATLSNDAGIAISPNSLLAGSSWSSLPIVAQQLIFDLTADWALDQHQAIYQFVDSGITAAEENGGGVNIFDEEVTESLANANEEILNEVETSDAFDGSAYLERLEESINKWAAITEELEYANEGDYSNFLEWYEGDLTDMGSSDYLEPFYERYGQEIVKDNRPG